MLVDRLENVMRYMSLNYHKLFENFLQDLLNFFLRKVSHYLIWFCSVSESWISTFYFL